METKTNSPLPLPSGPPRTGPWLRLRVASERVCGLHHSSAAEPARAAPRAGLAAEGSREGIGTMKLCSISLGSFKGRS